MRAWTGRWRFALACLAAAGVAGIRPGLVGTSHRASAPRARVVAGVAGLQTWMRSRFPAAFEPIASNSAGEYDCVYVDINEIIHHVVRRAASNEELVKLVLYRISLLLKVTSPRVQVVFAVDGPGPLAKVLTQRQRRRKIAAKAERSDAGGVDSLSLSPGTLFMLELSDALESYAQRRLAHASTRTDVEQVAYIVSGAHVAGEGEVKCLEHLLELAEAGGRETHVLHGSDSDIILLALASGVGGVDVLAPVRGGGGGGGGRAGPKAPQYELFSTDRCASALARLLPPAGPDGRRALDLICAAILASGNDYLPALQSAKLDSMFNLFSQLAHAADGGADGPMHLVRLERETDGKASSSRVARARLDRPALAALLVALQRARALRLPAGLPPSAANGPLEVLAEAASEAELRVAEEYVRGLDWVLTQYVTGRCPDFGLVPISPPTLPALYAVLAAPAPTAAAAAAVAAAPRAALVRPAIPAVYNLLVQPSAGQSVVPAALRPLMGAASPIGWLYTQGCTCAECARLHGALLPLMRDAQLNAPRTDDAMLARFEAAQAAMRPLVREEREHLDARHGGERLMHNELPAVELVEALVAQTPADALSKQERRTLSLAQPVRLGRLRAPRLSERAAPADARAPQPRAQRQAGPAASRPQSGPPPRAAAGGRGWEGPPPSAPPQRRPGAAARRPQ